MMIKHTAISSFAAVLAVSLGAVLTSAQSRPPLRAEENASLQITHWTSVLNRLVLEAKTLQDEAARPEAVVAVADAFWDVDRKKSTELFKAAFDLASSLPFQKDHDLAVRRVIVAAAKRDISLAKDLVTQLQA